MLQALKKSLGNVSGACEKANIERSAHYRWMEDDEGYKRDVDDLENIALDYVESKLFNSISNGSDTAIIFFLKTKGKKRGYVERHEINLTGDIVVDLPDDID